MIRDLTMIFAVIISIVSVSFGFYQTIQVRNSHAFIYEQAYRIIGVIQNTNLSVGTKAQLSDAALSVLGTPAPVIDLSRSSADTGTTAQVCTTAQRTVCADAASRLATANNICAKARGDSPACDEASALKSNIYSLGCFICYTQ